MPAGEERATLLGHTNLVSHVAFTPDGQVLASVSWDETVRLWDAQTGLALAEPLRARERVLGARFTADSRWVTTASGLVFVRT